MKNFLLFSLLLLLSASLTEATTPPVIAPGITQEEFYSYYSKNTARTYRKEGADEWVTFGDEKLLITIHFKDGIFVERLTNDRKEITTEYLSEFCSATIRHAFPKIHQAIRNVLENMPIDAFIKATDRKRPVLFTEFFDSGTAQFASSSEIIALPDDVPAFQQGLTILKISTALEQAENPKAIEGIVAHELAHRVLDHVRSGKTTCDAEREANRLIKTWGFAEAYDEASAAFGHEVHGDGENPCQ